MITSKTVLSAFVKWSRNQESDI